MFWASSGERESYISTHSRSLQVSQLHNTLCLSPSGSLMSLISSMIFPLGPGAPSSPSCGTTPSWKRTCTLPKVGILLSPLQLLVSRKLGALRKFTPRHVTMIQRSISITRTISYAYVHAITDKKAVIVQVIRFFHCSKCPIEHITCLAGGWLRICPCAPSRPVFHFVSLTIT